MKHSVKQLPKVIVSQNVSCTCPKNPLSYFPHQCNHCNNFEEPTHTNSQDKR